MPEVLRASSFMGKGASSAWSDLRNPTPMGMLRFRELGVAHEMAVAGITHSLLTFSWLRFWKREKKEGIAGTRTSKRKKETCQSCPLLSPLFSDRRNTQSWWPKLQKERNADVAHTHKAGTGEGSGGISQHLRG